MNRNEFWARAFENIKETNVSITRDFFTYHFLQNYRRHLTSKFQDQKCRQHFVLKRIQNLKRIDSFLTKKTFIERSFWLQVIVFAFTLLCISGFCFQVKRYFFHVRQDVCLQKYPDNLFTFVLLVLITYTRSGNNNTFDFTVFIKNLKLFKTNTWLQFTFKIKVTTVRFSQKQLFKVSLMERKSTFRFVQF